MGYTIKFKVQCKHKRHGVTIGKYYPVADVHGKHYSIAADDYGDYAHLPKDCFERPVQFTGYWVSGFGWESTAYAPEDFVKVDKLGENPIDGTVFIATDERGTRYILNGKYLQ